mmetsp:Transcript_14752/g.21673  ORF Transcript_14752/g.21673 Transcript_14752/m.21673 type:complete len:95 (+) Transcript_14752:134-418(+)
MPVFNGKKTTGGQLSSDGAEDAVAAASYVDCGGNISSGLHPERMGMKTHEELEPFANTVSAFLFFKNLLWASVYTILRYRLCSRFRLSCRCLAS